MNQESQKTDLQKRKQIIRSLAVGGLAVTAWQKPIVNSVLLPAHAQQSGDTTADPANPSGQAGQSGQTGQTEQGQTNQEQTAVPQQNQQEDSANRGIPDHSRVEPLPAGRTLATRDCTSNAVQIVEYRFAGGDWDVEDVGPDFDRSDTSYAHIKITGVANPVKRARDTRLQLNLDLEIGGRTLIMFSQERLPGNGQALRISQFEPAGLYPYNGLFTVQFANWNAGQNRPFTQAELNNATLVCK